MNRNELRKLFDLYSRNQMVWGDFVRGVEALASREEAPATPKAELMASYPLNRTDARQIVHALEAATQRVLGNVNRDEYKQATGWQIAQRLRAFIESGSIYQATPPAAIPAAPSDAAILEVLTAWYHNDQRGAAPDEAAVLRLRQLFLTQPATVQQAEPPSSLPLPSDEAINEMAFQHELIAEGSWNEDAVAFGRELLQPYATELERLRGLINTPHTDDFFTAINLEAAHQIERFGDKHDQGKTPTDWLFLIGYLAGKAATSFIRGDAEKGKHHIVSSGAVLLNWWRHATGVHTEFRPGHGGE